MSETELAERRLRKRRLAAAGFDIANIYNNPTDRERLARRTSVIVDLLEEITTPRVKVDLVRALANAKISPEPFIDELNRTRDLIIEDQGNAQAMYYAWTLAEALASSKMPRKLYDDTRALLQDKRLGDSRQMLPYALAKVKARRADTIEVLLRLLGDSENKEIFPVWIEMRRAHFRVRRSIRLRPVTTLP